MSALRFVPLVRPWHRPGPKTTKRGTLPGPAHFDREPLNRFPRWTRPRDVAFRWPLFPSLYTSSLTFRRLRWPRSGARCDIFRLLAEYLDSASTLGRSPAKFRDTKRALEAPPSVHLISPARSPMFQSVEKFVTSLDLCIILPWNHDFSASTFVLPLHLRRSLLSATRFALRNRRLHCGCFLLTR